jgi:Talin IBS2B domain
MRKKKTKKIKKTVFFLFFFISMAATSSKVNDDVSLEAQGRRETLGEAMNPLVDALSSLILCAVSGDMAEVKQHATGVALYTNKVVEAARDIALASRDSQIQMDISKAINSVASAVETLVVAFSSFVANKSDFECQKGFAKATKDVGDAINALVVATDETSLSKLLALVDDCKGAGNALNGAASRDAMVQGARALSNCLVSLLEAVSVSATQTADARKAILLEEGGADSKRGVMALITAAAARHGDTPPADAVGAQRAAYAQAAGAFDKLVAAARIVPDYSKRFSDAYDEAMRQLIDLANALQQFSRRLVDLLNDPNHSREDFLAEASRAARAAKAFLAHAERALGNIEDPGRRRQVQALINEIRDLATDLVRTAKLAEENPDDASLKERLRQINDALNQKIRQLIVLSSPDGEEVSAKLNMSSRFLDALVDELAERLDSLSRDELLDYARGIRELTATVARDAQAVAAAEPAKRDAILASLPPMVNKCKALASTTEALADTPRDAALRERFGAERGEFNEAVHLVRVAAGLELPRIKNEPPPPLARDSDHELVRAAQQQAAAALALAARAREYAASVRDPDKRTRILDGADRLEALAADIVASAERAAANPDDPAAQRALDVAQRALAEAIRTIVELTAGKGSSLAALLEDMQLAAALEQDDAHIFTLAEQLFSDIDEFVRNVAEGKLDPKAMVAQARAIAANAAELAKLLMALAARTDDPSLRQQLRQMANVLKDKGVQIKMLAAIQVASFGATGEDTGQVTSALRALRSETSEVVNIVRVAALRRRVSRTNKQTEAIRALLAAWNEAHSLVQ